MLALLNRARTRREDGEDGFTLIELLVVVVILGILIAIAIPVYLNYRKSANDKAAQSDLRGAISTLEVCNSDNSYPTAITTTITAANGTMTNCGTGAGSLQKSASTYFSTYTISPTGAAAGAVTSYVLVAYNTSGTPKYYCYNSANGGALTSSTTAITTC